MKYIYAIALSLLCLQLSAQKVWQDVGTTFTIPSNQCKLVVANDTAFVAFYDFGSETAVVLKNVDTQWVEVARVIAFNQNLMDIEVDNQGNVFLAAVADQFDFANNMNQRFVFIYRYNGSLFEQVDGALMTVRTTTLGPTDIFDFATNPQGGYGFIYRYTDGFLTDYMFKKPGNVAFSYTALYNNTTFFIKNGKLVYTDSNTAYVVGRNESNLGVVNRLMMLYIQHDSLTSIPVTVGDGSTVALEIADDFQLSAGADTIYVGYTLADGSGTGVVNGYRSGLIVDSDSVKAFPNVIRNPSVKVNSANEKYLSTIFQSGITKIGEVSFSNPAFRNTVLVGGSSYNLPGQTVDFVSDYLYQNDMYVAYLDIVSLELNVRKASCLPAPDYAYDSVFNQIEPITTITGFPTYQWFNCTTNQDIPNATSSRYTPQLTGTYAVRITNGECAYVSNCVSVDLGGPLSTASELTNPVRVYPNPATAWITISGITELVDVHVYTIHGQLVRTHTQVQAQQMIPVEDLTPGVYVTRVINANGSETQHKWIKN